MSIARKSIRGGKREGAGRKSQGKERVTLSLTAELVAAVKQRTDNLSGLVDGLLADWIKKK